MDFSSGFSCGERVHLFHDICLLAVNLNVKTLKILVPYRKFKKNHYSKFKFLKYLGSLGNKTFYPGIKGSGSKSGLVPDLYQSQLNHLTEVLLHFPAALCIIYFIFINKDQA